ncbi:MAG: NAD-dependent epimerase/dehydratase family protein, partial [Bacteroidales bacterium]|nr:NAD-dependent epimerase/dehydratase family protein [Bacteroidales bacterium]
YECTEESELINPVWDYSINKVKCEEKLKELCEKNNLIYTIVRPAVTYGNTRIPYGITPPYGYHGTLIHRMLSKKPIILWDDGEAYSTITHVEDFAYGLVGIIGNVEAYNQVYHIVGDERVQWKKVIELMGEILGVTPITLSVSKEKLAEEIPSRKGEILGGRGINQLLDNTKIKKTVKGFGTRISLKDGMTRTIEYYKDNKYLKGIDYGFDGDWDRIVKKNMSRESHTTIFI